MRFHDRRALSPPPPPLPPPPLPPPPPLLRSPTSSSLTERSSDASESGDDTARMHYAESEIPHAVGPAATATTSAAAAAAQSAFPPFANLHAAAAAAAARRSSRRQRGPIFSHEHARSDEDADDDDDHDREEAEYSAEEVLRRPRFQDAARRSHRAVASFRHAPPIAATTIEMPTRHQMHYFSNVDLFQQQDADFNYLKVSKNIVMWDASNIALI